MKFSLGYKSYISSIKFALKCWCYSQQVLLLGLYLCEKILPGSEQAWPYRHA